jgi:hypothetical protein
MEVTAMLNLINNELDFNTHSKLRPIIVNLFKCQVLNNKANYNYDYFRASIFLNL